MDSNCSLPKLLRTIVLAGEGCLLSWKDRAPVQPDFFDEDWLQYTDEDEVFWILWTQIPGPIRIMLLTKSEAPPEAASHAPEAPAAIASLGDDLLHGAENVALFMFGDPAMRRKIYTYANDPKFGVPLFRMGSVICARKTRITQWIADQEAASIKERK